MAFLRVVGYLKSALSLIGPTERQNIRESMMLELFGQETDPRSRVTLSPSKQALGIQNRFIPGSIKTYQ